MVEQHIGRLLLQNKSQQGQIDCLRRQMASTLKTVDGLQEELGALRECLVASSVLRSGHLAALLHRRRFDSVLRRCSCVWDVLLTDVVNAPGVVHPILQFAGASSLCHFAACAAALRDGAERSQQFAARPTRLYLFGGSADRFPLSSVLRFDVTCRVWEELAPMPTARDYLAAAGAGKHIYAVGGTDGERAFDTVECFHTDLARWHELQSMPTARGGLAAAVVHETLYAIGGSNGTRALGTVEMLDLEVAEAASCGGEMLENMWQTGPRLLTPRRGLAVAVMDRFLYAIGGSDGGMTLDTVECLDTAQGHAWVPMPPMPTPRRAAAAAVHKGRIYVVGGAGGSRDSSLAVTERFDPERFTWETLMPMPSARRGLALLPVDGMLYALGGSDGTRTFSAVEVFDPATNMWDVRPPMPARRGYFGTAVIQTFELLRLTAAPEELRRAMSSVRQCRGS